MKKALLFLVVVLVAALFIYGCGGGGGTISSSSPEGPSGGAVPSNPPATGTITVTLPGPAQTANARIMSVLPSPDDYRVAFGQTTTDPDTGVTTRTILDIQDGAPGATIVSKEFPVGGGYSVDVISYKTNTPAAGVNTLLKYGGVQDIVIKPGPNTANITMSPVTAALAPPDVITNTSSSSGNPFAVSTSPAFPLRNSSSYVRFDTSPVATTPDSLSFSLMPHTFTAPVTSSTVTLYFQGLYYIDPALLKAGESASNWRYYNPNPVYGDPQILSVVQGPGSINVVITP